MECIISNILYILNCFFVFVFFCKLHLNCIHSKQVDSLHPHDLYPLFSYKNIKVSKDAHVKISHLRRSRVFRSQPQIGGPGIPQFAGGLSLESRYIHRGGTGTGLESLLREKILGRI